MQNSQSNGGPAAWKLPRGARRAALTMLLLVFAFGLFDHTLWSGNDSREGAMIAEMFRTGRWVTPVFNGTPYLEKPPLLHWTGLLFCHLFGIVNEGLVRLPAALFGLCSVLVLFLWAREMGRERAGLIAALMCATTIHYFEYSKVVLTDMAISCMVILSLYIFLKAYRAEKHRVLLYAVFLFVSAFSFYAKGLLGPGCVWVAVCAFLFYERRWKLFFLLPLLFLPVFLAVLAPWVAALWHEGGSEMVKSVFWDNQFGRFLSFSDKSLPQDPFFVHKEPIYFYLAQLPPRMMPWTLLALPALVYWFRKSKAPSTQPAVLLRFGFAAIVLALHLSTAKAKAYALPLYPFVFLMAGVWLEDAAMKGTSRLEKALIWLTVALAALALLLAPLAFLAGVLAKLDPIWAVGANTLVWSSVTAALSVCVALFAGSAMLREYKSGARVRLLLPAFALAAGLMVMEASAFYPLMDNQRTYVPFVDLVRKELAAGRRVALASEHEKDCGQFMFYLDRQIEVVSRGTNMTKAFCAQDRPTGLIVPEKELWWTVRYLSITCDDREHPVLGPYERPFKKLKCDHNGYKAREFVLLLNENEPSD